MDFEELSKHYMEKYNELTEKRDNSGIVNTIEDINEAILGSNIEGARIALNAQFSFLHLPSAMLFSIAFDEDEKKWKFNAEIK